MRFIDLVFSAMVLFLYGMAVVCLGMVILCGFAIYAAWESGWGSDPQGFPIEFWVICAVALVGALGFAWGASRVDRAWDLNRRTGMRGFEVKVTKSDGAEESGGVN